MKDINLAEKVFNTDVANCKGKNTRPSPPVVATNDLIELPLELVTDGRKIELTIGIVFINNKRFLHSVDCTLKFNGLVALVEITKGERCTLEVL